MLTRHVGVILLAGTALLVGPTTAMHVHQGWFERPEPQSSRVAAVFPSVEEFGRAVADLRAIAPEEPAAREGMGRALRILDSVVIASLGGRGKDTLLLTNQRLSAYVSREPAAGESYRLYQVGKEAYALAANFGSSGPSGVVVYARPDPQAQLAVVGTIERFSQKDYFDDYLELVPVDLQQAVFLTVTGRTDELQSGWFAAWQFDGKAVVEMWSSELLPHSSYEAVSRGIVINYCADSDEQDPSVCRAITREAHLWDGTSWQVTQDKKVAAPRR
jgi:hypothetical protein